MTCYFTVLHMSAADTTRTSRHVRSMSVIEGISEVKCSLRVFRMLTQTGHRATNFAVTHNAGLGSFGPTGNLHETA
jgi:hypothetical protein